MPKPKISQAENSGRTIALMSAKSFTKISSNPKRIKPRSKRFTPGVLMEERNPPGQQREEDSPTDTYTKTCHPLQNATCVQRRGWAEGLTGQGLWGH